MIIGFKSVFAQFLVKIYVGSIKYSTNVKILPWNSPFPDQPKFFWKNTNPIYKRKYQTERTFLSVALGLHQQQQSRGGGLSLSVLAFTETRSEADLFLYIGTVCIQTINEREFMVDPDIDEVTIMLPEDKIQVSHVFKGQKSSL